MVVPCPDEHGMGTVQGKGGRTIAIPPTSATKSVGKTESSTKGVGKGVSPPFPSIACPFDSPSPVVFAVVAFREGESRNLEVQALPGSHFVLTQPYDRMEVPEAAVRVLGGECSAGLPGRTTTKGLETRDYSERLAG